MHFEMDRQMCANINILKMVEKKVSSLITENVGLWYWKSDKIIWAISSKIDPAYLKIYDHQ
jgi:hypothetical protein